MPDAKAEKVLPPFTAFNFAVEITVPGIGQVCNAAFAEADGLEMSIQPKTIREGGNNNRQIHLSGPISYGQLTLKRGMTTAGDLWTWFEKRQRADAEVVLFAADGNDVAARFLLGGCMPVKVKAPALNAKEGTIAIEELQLAYEWLQRKL